MSVKLLVNNNSKEFLIELEEHADECPFCGRLVQINVIRIVYVSDFLVDIVYSCPREPCKRVYVGSFRRENADIFKCLRVYPNPPKEKEFQSIIHEISPSFVEIYNDAYAAEQHGLVHICGMGYRKALEFLIKDYVILNNPEAAEIVQDHKTTLGKVIKEYLDDPRIIKTSERAVWLGNDETHYSRKWDNKDVGDLKILIELVLHWISMSHLTDLYLSNMQ